MNRANDDERRKVRSERSGERIVPPRFEREALIATVVERLRSDQSYEVAIEQDLHPSWKAVWQALNAEEGPEPDPERFAARSLARHRGVDTPSGDITAAGDSLDT